MQGWKDNTYLVPDPAFLLETVKSLCRRNFTEGGMVGLNVESAGGGKMKRCRGLPWKITGR